MNSDRRLTRSRSLLFIGVLLALMVATVAPAAAAAEVTVDAPTQVTVGDDITVTAIVVDEGEPVVGALMNLSFVGTTAGKSGWAVLDTGFTDEDGSVTFHYQQRALGGERMRVEYFGVDGQENSEFEVQVTDGAQLFESHAGVDVPAIGLWWVYLLIALVWGLIIYAYSFAVRIGRASDLEGGPVKITPRFTFGFVVFTVVGMFLVIIARPQSHANLDPTAPFERAPGSVVGVDYEYSGLGSGDLISANGELSGETLYVQGNCVGCHGSGGAGAITGDALIGEEGDSAPNVNSFIEDIRDGPKGMPAYDEANLSDRDVEAIHEYLFGPAVG